MVQGKPSVRLLIPFDQYDEGRFVNVIEERRIALGWSPGELARRAGVYRSSLKHVRERRRRCVKEDRAAVLDALGLSELKDDFGCTLDSRNASNSAGSLDVPKNLRSELDSGVRLLALGCAGAAAQEFRKCGDRADELSDHALRVEARAFRAQALREGGWLFLSRAAALGAIRELAELIGVPVFDFLERPVDLASRISAVAPVDETYYAVSIAQYVYAAACAEEAIYDPRCCEHAYVAAAALRGLARVQESILDGTKFHGMKRQQGHRLRIAALLSVVDLNLEGEGDDPTKAEDTQAEPDDTELPYEVADQFEQPETDELRDAEDIALHFLKQSRQCFSRTTFDRACVTRDYGVVHWHLGKPAAAEHYLLQALGKFSKFANVRASALTAYAVSNVGLRRNWEPDQIRYYALAAAALHPCDFILDHARAQIKNLCKDRLKDDIARLQLGKWPFDIVQEFIARRMDGAPNDCRREIAWNVARVFEPWAESRSGYSSLHYPLLRL